MKITTALVRPAGCEVMLALWRKERLEEKVQSAGYRMEVVTEKMK